jgi:hypothetical protein
MVTPEKSKPKARAGWVKGQSGNPAGKKPGTRNKATLEIRALARDHGETAIKRLVHLLDHALSETAQIQAAKELLDRGFGKPAQAVELSGKDGAPMEVRSLREGLEALTPKQRAAIRAALTVGRGNVG